MQKCRAQTKGLIVLFSLPVVALDPGGHTNVLKWRVWKLWWSRKSRMVPVWLKLLLPGCSVPAFLSQAAAFLLFSPNAMTG